MNPYLSVIIPAYNEESRLGQTLSAIYAYLCAQDFTWEVIVVLDGSQDNTLAVLHAFVAGEGRPHEGQFRWIPREENRGKGFTVREGMLAAHGDIRLFTDADNSTDINHFDKMRPLFAAGADIVICSRDRKDADDAQQAVPQNPVKRFLGNTANLLIQVVAVPGIWDTQCGFKAFTAPAAAHIFSLAQIDRWGFDIEALALGRRFGYEIGVVGAYWVNREGTHVRPVDYFKTLGDTFRTRWNLMTGVYDHAPRPVPDETPQV
jgi:dolichyl-phosphate beta-glucosyltransferase